MEKIRGVNPDEIDVRLLIRAALSYYKQLDNHIKGVKVLPQETVKFIADRVLEITLTLEDIANEIYENLTPEEKAILEFAEVERNKFLYMKTNGEPNSDKSMEYIKALKDASTAHYNQVREIANEKLNLSQEQ